MDDKHLVKWMRMKNYVEKRLFKTFLTEDKSLDGVKTLIKIPVRDL